MITLEDCLAFCGLTEAEVMAIAEHEHIPEVAAAGMANYLLCSDHGAERIREMIVDDLVEAHRRNDTTHARELAWCCGIFWRRIPKPEAARRREDGRLFGGASVAHQQPRRLFGGASVALAAARRDRRGGGALCLWRFRCRRGTRALN